MASSGDDAFAHCRQLIAQADKDRYWASLYAPAEKRLALYALYAFDLEIARVADVVREPMAGEIRLQWWREVLEGKRQEESAAHPVAAALIAVLRQYPLPATRLSALIDARGFDLYDDPMARLADLENYGAATGGTIFALAAQILGGEAETIAREAGAAQAYASALRALVQGGGHIPLEALQRFGANRDDIHAQKATFELRAALAEMRLHARRHLNAAAEMLADIAPQVLPALLPAATIRPSLARMEKKNYRPFAGNELPPWRRQYLIWRAAGDPRRIFG